MSDLPPSDARNPPADPMGDPTGSQVPPPATAPRIIPNAVHQMPWIGFTFSNAWSQGIEVLKAQYGMLLAAVGITFGVQMVQSVVGQVVTLMGQLIDPTVGVVLNLLFSLLLTVLVSWPLQVSTQYVAVAARRGEQISMQTLFRGFYRFGTSVLTMFLASLIYIACAIPSVFIIGAMFLLNRQGQIGDELAIGVGVVVALINGVAIMYMMARLSLAQAMCVDSRLGSLSAVDSIKMSWEWTRECAWVVFGVMLTAGIAMIASVLLLCVGYLLVGMPLVLAIYGAMYHQIGFDRGVFPMRNICPVCNYDLSGVNVTTCPECGSNVVGYTNARTYASPGVPPMTPAGPDVLPPPDPFGPRGSDGIDPYAPRPSEDDPYRPR